VIALFERDSLDLDVERHFGLVVDDLELVRQALKKVGIRLGGDEVDFHDPWGNRAQVVQYGEVLYRKDGGMLAQMGLSGLST
jgi:lactoylglutathione lyase